MKSHGRREKLVPTKKEQSFLGAEGLRHAALYRFGARTSWLVVSIHSINIGTGHGEAVSRARDGRALAHYVKADPELKTIDPLSKRE